MCCQWRDKFMWKFLPMKKLHRLYSFIILVAKHWKSLCAIAKPGASCSGKVRTSESAKTSPLDLPELSHLSSFTYSCFVVPRSYLDMAKVVMFSFHFWFVLCLIFITGTTRINILCMGYLMACFHFMLFGGTLLLKPVRHMLKLWDYLITYTAFVITMKNLLSVRVSWLFSLHGLS